MVVLLLCVLSFDVCAETISGENIEDVVRYFEKTVSNINACDKQTDDNIQIDFNETTGTLVVSGSGYIRNFFSREWGADVWGKEFVQNWNNQNIKHLVVEEGITGIENSFNDCVGLVDIRLPQTLNHLQYSFNGCGKVQQLSASADCIEYSFLEGRELKTICVTAKDVMISFNNCPNLEDVNLSQDLQVAYGSFEDCGRLEKIFCGERNYTVSELKKIYAEESDDLMNYGEEMLEKKPSDEEKCWAVSLSLLFVGLILFGAVKVGRI